MIIINKYLKEQLNADKEGERRKEGKFRSNRHTVY